MVRASTHPTRPGAGDLTEALTLGAAAALSALTRNDVGAARGGVAVAALLRAFGM